MTAVQCDCPTCARGRLEVEAAQLRVQQETVRLRKLQGIKAKPSKPTRKRRR